MLGYLYLGGYGLGALWDVPTNEYVIFGKARTLLDNVRARSLADDVRATRVEPKP